MIPIVGITKSEARGKKMVFLIKTLRLAAVENHKCGLLTSSPIRAPQRKAEHSLTKPVIVRTHYVPQHRKGYQALRGFAARPIPLTFVQHNSLNHPQFL